MINPENIISLLFSTIFRYSIAKIKTTITISDEISTNHNIFQYLISFIRYSHLFYHKTNLKYYCYKIFTQTKHPSRNFKLQPLLSTISFHKSLFLQLKNNNAYDTLNFTKHTIGNTKENDKNDLLCPFSDINFSFPVCEYR